MELCTIDKYGVKVKRKSRIDVIPGMVGEVIRAMGFACFLIPHPSTLNVGVVCLFLIGIDAGVRDA